MTFVVTEPCIKCKYADCVTPCPTTAFREGANMLAIDPDACIDCGVCIDYCPVHAIYPDAEVPDKWKEYIALNTRLARVWPEISRDQPPLDSAEEFRAVESKRSLLDENPAS